MKNFRFGYKTTTRMKKLLVLILLAFSVSLVSAQTNSENKAKVTVAYGLDSLKNPKYGDIFLIAGQAPFYIVVNDVVPVSCNKMKVTAYFRDSTNGKSANNYWVKQGTFDFPITPYYYGYWMQMNAYTVGEYRIEVSGYLNGNYVKYFGSSTFYTYSEDDFWLWGIWGE